MYMKPYPFVFISRGSSCEWTVGTVPRALVAEEEPG
jgi:hypothetical protein